MEASIYQIVDYKSGVSNKGPWEKLTYIVKADTFIAVTSWGEDAQLVNTLKINDRISFDLDISAREWNGKWYNDVTAKNVVSDESNGLPPLETKKPDPGVQGNLNIGTEDIDHDLPF